MVLPYINMNPPRVYMCSPSWTPLPPPFPSHPSGSSQCTSPKHPVSCIEPGLAICFTYGNKHVSMQFSQIIPPLPSPTESKSLFFTSVSLLLEKDLMLGKIEGRRRGRQRMRWLDGIPDSMDMNLSDLWEMVKNREAWLAVVHGVTKSRGWPSDWTMTLQKPWEKQALFF